MDYYSILDLKREPFSTSPDIVKLILGKVTSKYLDALLTINPHIKNYNYLNQALKGLKKFRRKYKNIRMIIYWNAADGLRFSVGLDEYFSQKSQAEKRLKMLADDWICGLKLTEDWQENTLFFSHLSNNWN